MLIKHRPIATRLFASLLAASLVGCATPDRFQEPPAAELMGMKQDPESFVAPEGVGEVSLETVGGVTREGAFFVRQSAPANKSQLPDLRVENLSVTESGLKDAMELVLDGSGIGFHIDGGAKALERGGAVSLTGITGSLPDVMDHLAKSMGFFWSFDGKTLTVQPEQSFVIELPPAIGDDSFAGMTNTLQFLGAKDAYLDRVMRTLSFRANARSLGSIEQYMKRVRETRSMIVYQVRIYEVDISSNGEAGINWNKLGASDLSRAKPVSATQSLGGSSTDGALRDLAKAIALTKTGAGLGTVIVGPHFNFDAFFGFLKSQGEVKTVSQPRLAMLNGGKGLLRVGQTTTFVSKVGSNLGSGISQVTVETKDLRTGVELSLSGDESDRTVYTRIKLALSNLNGLQNFQALGTDLNLPRIDDRELETSIRLPAGYTALLGGINVTRQRSDREVGAATNYKKTEMIQSEMVVVIQPTIVRFMDPSAQPDTLQRNAAISGFAGPAQQPQ